MSFIHKIFKPGNKLTAGLPDGWEEVDATTYADAYTQFGGSVITHPLVIAAMGTMAAIKTTYCANYLNGQLVAALPVWGESYGNYYIAGDKRYLKKNSARSIFDTGNAEVILPVAPEQKICVQGFNGQFISELHQDNVLGIKPQKETLSLARSLAQGEFSGKFRYNRRRELKQFLQDGGEVIPFSQLNVSEIATLYTNLFELRWGKKPKGHERLEEFIHAIRPLVHGHLLAKESTPVAIQLIYLSSTAIGVSAEYINGGVDPQFKQYSPGSILSFINLQNGQEIATGAGLPLRFSYGITDNEYKDAWCNPHPIYRF